MPGDVFSDFKVKEQINRVVVFQIILTADDGAHKFVVLSVVAASLTNYLNCEKPFTFVRKE